MRLKNLPIKKKLSLLMTLTSTLVLCVSALIWTLHDWKSYRKILVTHLDMLGQVTADNIAAAVSFQNQEEGTRVLSTLRANPLIEGAYAFSANGVLFASYASVAPTETDLAQPQTAPEPGAVFLQSHLRQTSEIFLDGERIGTLVIDCSTKEFRNHLLTAILLAAGLLILAILGALLLSQKLQSIITRPLLALLRTTEQIRNEQRFDIRAEKLSEDEIGLLADGFNDMLQEIASRDQRLERHREQLEEEVAARTKELLASERKIHSIVDTAADAILSFDESGKLVSFNKAAEQVFGYGKEEVLGRDFSLLTASQKTSKPYLNLTEHLIARASEASVLGREFSGLHKDGREFPMELSLTRVDSPEGAQYTCILRDITERKAVLDQLIQAKEAAEQLARTKSEFLANMSHEIRTPMNGIFGALQLVLKSDLDDDQRELISIMKDSADSLLRIINDILDFSKIDAGKLKLAQTPFVIADAIEKSLGVLRIHAGQQGLEFITDCPAKFPMVMGDPERLGQIFINLVGNAIKFTPKGGSVTLSVREHSRDKQHWVFEFLVSDTGVGIPQEKQKLIFDAFAQADTSSTRQFGGTGLGLTIVSKLLHLMGGEIFVESAPGQGSTFRFLLPLRLADESRPVQSSLIKRPTPTTNGSNANGLHVLLVEDNHTNQIIGRSMLKNLGLQVSVVNNGQEALDALEKQDFEIIFMDCQMPIMDGFTATQRIREKEQSLDFHQVIVAMTAHALEGDRERCLENGMDDYISKPIDERELEGLLLRLKEGASMGGEQHGE